MEAMEGPLAIKDGQLKLRFSELLEPRPADEAECSMNNALQFVFRRERAFERRESLGAYKNIICLSIPSGHARRGDDIAARDLAIFCSRVRPIQHSRPGVLLRSLLYTVRPKIAALAPTLSLDSALIAGCYYSDSANYYHFWCDAIIDVWAFVRGGGSLSSVDAIIMPFSRKSWQLEILEICAIPSGLVVGLHEFSRCSVGKGYFCFRSKGGRSGSPWVLPVLQAIVHPQKYADSSSPQRIYSTRLGALRRALLNEEEVCALMAKRGYAIVDCSAKSVRSQVMIFRNASHIVAPHGASLTNIAWCQPGAQVLDLMPVLHANPCFYDLALSGGLKYDVFPLQPASGCLDPLLCPVEVDIVKLEAFLSERGFF